MNKIIEDLTTLDKDLSDKISFIIPEFARAYKMNIQNAYLYLKKYGGIAYLDKNYWASY